MPTQDPAANAATAHRPRSVERPREVESQPAILACDHADDDPFVLPGMVDLTFHLPWGLPEALEPFARHYGPDAPPMEERSATLFQIFVWEDEDGDDLSYLGIRGMDIPAPYSKRLSDFTRALVSEMLEAQKREG